MVKFSSIFIQVVQFRFENSRVVFFLTPKDLKRHLAIEKLYLSRFIDVQRETNKVFFHLCLNYLIFNFENWRVFIFLEFHVNLFNRISIFSKSQFEFSGSHFGIFCPFKQIYDYEKKLLYFGDANPSSYNYNLEPFNLI